MTGRAATRLAVVFFAAYAVALTYPGFLPFNRVRPLVLGLPFSLVWVVLWVLLSGVVLLIVYLSDPETGD